MPRLAIVIPAFKITYFETALDSLVRQTCHDFNVYIGDDCSPFNLKEVADRYAEKLPLSYTRFDNNIGSENLVKQWERSVALSKDEEWIWLFSDDDVADATCVENFYKITDSNKDRFDVYRFNTVVIGEKGEVVRKVPEGPAEESSEQMAYHLLMAQRGNSMQDHIFSRKIYQATGGFVFTRFAQGADWATSILFSQKKGMAIIPVSRFQWRLSTSNVSGSALRQKSTMFSGHLQFLTWVLKHFEYLKNSNFPVTYGMISNGARFNLVHVIIYHYKGLTFKNLWEIVPFMRQQLALSYSQIMYDLHSIFISTTVVGRWYLKGVLFLKKVFGSKSRNHTNQQ